MEGTAQETEIYVRKAHCRGWSEPPVIATLLWDEFLDRFRDGRSITAVWNSLGFTIARGDPFTIEYSWASLRY